MANDKVIRNPLKCKNNIVFSITNDLNGLLIGFYRDGNPRETQKLRKIKESINSYFDDGYYADEVDDFQYKDFKESGLMNLLVNLRENVKENALEARLWLPVIKSYFVMVRNYLDEMAELEKQTADKQ